MRKHVARVGAMGMAAFVVTLAGCTAAPAESNESGIEWDADAAAYVMEEEVASGEVPLRVWVEYPEYGEALVAAFNEIYPDVKVELTTVAKVDAVNKMQLDGEAGKGADVYTTNFTDLPRAIEAGVAAPIGEYSAAVTERVGEEFASAVSKDGELYGVPVSTESIGLFTNTTLLEELTGSAEPASTWEEIVDLASTYNDQSANRWTIRWLAGEMYYAYPVLSSNGWSMGEDESEFADALASDELLTGLEYYQGLRDIWDVNSADATWDSIEMEFAKGATPYVITGPWAFGDFDAAAAELGFEYAVTPLPQIEGGDEAATLAGLSVGAVSGYSEYPAASRIFADFLSSEAASEALYTTTGAIPALAADAIADVPGLADDAHAAGILEQSRRADLISNITDAQWTVANDMVSSVWDGAAEPADAQEAAVTGFEDLSGLSE
ncbi:MAG TPA: extracellular solute-binding protein [Microbacterium sp.]|nr:extracellular solute-binding protein [Microbacterium sp.]